LPVVQASLLHALHEYNCGFDDMRKLRTLPYWEAATLLKRHEKQIVKSRKEGRGLTVLSDLLLPAVGRVMMAQHRMDRKLGALRIVEAIRLHAAKHVGKLPARLDLIDEVPIPLDPFTGKAFEYQVKGTTAYLSAPPPAGEQAHEGNAIRLEIT